MGELGSGQRARWMAGVALSGVIGSLVAGAAFAQATDAAPPAAVQDVPPRSGSGAESPTARNVPADTGSAADIIVTGSRVISNGNNSPTPVTVASTQQLLEITPTSVIDGLNTLPGLLGSLTSTSNVNTGGFNTINLRGVGSTRALVLFNNKRLAPTRAGNLTDVDVIPQMLLQRVDVVTGGASAVYGSDAISGVVNFITDTKFTGFKADVQTGISRYGDDAKYKASAAWGTRLGDRGHFEIGYEYRKSNGFARSDRPFFDPIYSEQGSVPNGGTIGSAANPYKLYTGAVLSTVAFGGLINTGPLSGLQFAQNGQLSSFNTGTPTGTAGVGVGGDGAYYINSSAASRQRLHQGYGRFDYDITDGIHAYAEGTYTNFRQSVIQQSLLLSKVLIGYNNAYLSTLQPQYRAVVATQLAANPLGSFQLSKMESLIPANRPVTTENFSYGGAGLSGRLGSSWSWNVDYVYNHSEEKTVNGNNNSYARLYAALNAVVNPANGQIVCNAALTNPSAYGSCVPLNVFGPTSENAAAVAYINNPTSVNQIYNLNDISGTLKGTPFTLPAGPVSVALTGEWRRLTYKVASVGSPTDPVNCTGIQFNCTSATQPYTGGSTASRPKSEQDVKEVAIEAEVPLLHDIRFIQALTLNGAGRFTHYDTSGTVYTWKVGGDWKVSDALRFRATRSRDIRAPNLNDLYAPSALANQNYSDIHTGQSGQVLQLSSGNPNLKPEKADTLTAGAVIRPAFLHGFSLSIDYYRIKINQAIFSIPAFQVATQQACEQSNGTSPVCALYVRPLPFDNRTAANFPTLLLSQSLNIASVKTNGIDFEGNYTAPLGGGRLDARALVNWQPHLIYDNGPGGRFDVGGAADGVGGLPPIAKVKVVGSVAYAIGGFRGRVQERWRAAIRQNGTVGLVFVDGKIPATAYTDVNLSYDFTKAISGFFNIQNLLDKKPYPYASVGGSVQMNYLGGYAQGDDIEGRYFTIGLRLRL